MFQCNLCMFRCSFRTAMESHIRKFHPYQSDLSFTDQGITVMGNADDEISIPDPVVIDSGYSGGGGDFGGGGASSDF